MHAPRRIVVAVDFSETSLRAARLAMDVAASNATIYLAHVAPRDSSLYDWKGWGATYKQDAGDALQKMREQLRVPKDMTVQKVLLQGDPATELLAFATSVNADLIATGSHGHGFVARMLIGSVTTRDRAVLDVQRADGAARRGDDACSHDGRAAGGRPRSRTTDWAAELDEFTRRNIGRRGILEVDDPEIGAQAQEFDYPFARRRRSIRTTSASSLMFGDAVEHDARHLTRGISGVTSVDVLSNERATIWRFGSRMARDKRC